MKILPEPVIFEWDKWNSDKNFIKHKVSNKEAEEVFEKEDKVILVDEKHSYFEQRYMLWGVTVGKRKLAVFFTIRENKVRIISARDMHKKERREYEKNIKVNTKI